MSLTEIRSKMRSLARASFERPTLLRVRFDEQGEPVAAEIKASGKSLWSWPEGYRARIYKDQTPPANKPFHMARRERTISHTGFVA